MKLFNFDKVGPGVSKDAPRKKGIFLYFELFGRKFSKLISLNMLYFLCSIPMMLLYFALFWFTSPLLLHNLYVEIGFSQNDMALMNLILSLFSTIICTITFGTGPASASMAYVLREYSKEEHVWLVHSFFEKMKENFKKEIVVFIIDLVYILFAMFAVYFYLVKHLSTGSVIFFALFLLTVLISIIFMLMHYYIHQLIVTFENKLREIYKNALLLTLSTLFPCVLLTAFILILNYYLFNLITPVATIAVTFLFLLSFFRFPVEFYVHNTIKKIIPKEEPEAADEEEIIFSDLQGSEK